MLDWRIPIGRPGQRGSGLGVSIVLLLRVVLVGVFLGAGVAKLVASYSFRRTLGEIIPGHPRATGFLARSVPVTELCIAAALAFSETSRIGAIVAVAVLVAFSAAALRLVREQRPVRCNCFGPGGGDLDRATVARNSWLIAYALAIAAAPIAGWQDLVRSAATAIVFGAVCALPFLCSQLVSTWTAAGELRMRPR